MFCVSLKTIPKTTASFCELCLSSSQVIKPSESLNKYPKEMHSWLIIFCMYKLDTYKQDIEPYCLQHLNTKYFQF